MSKWIIRKLARFGIWVIELGPRYQFGELTEYDKATLAELRRVLDSVTPPKDTPA